MSLLAYALLATVGQTPITVTPGKLMLGLRPISMAAAPTGSRVLVGLEDGGVVIVDSTSRQITRKLATHLQPAYAVAWSPDGRFAASGDETARIWLEDVKSGKRIREYRNHTRGLQRLSFNRRGNLLLSTGKDDSILVYNLLDKKPKEARKFLGKGTNFYGATFLSASDSLFLTGTLGSGAQVFDSLTGRNVASGQSHGGQGILDVDVNPAGTRAASGGKDGNVVLWDTKTMKPVATLKGHGDFVLGVRFSANGRLLASTSSDRTIKVWDAVSFKLIKTLENQNFVGSPMAFTNDGFNLVTTNDAGALQINTLYPPQPAPKPVLKPVRKRRR